MNPSYGEWAAAICGLGLLAVMFAGWFTPGPNTSTLDAWESFSVTDIVLAVIAVTSILIAAVSLAGRSVSLPAAGSAITSLLSAGAIPSLLPLPAPLAIVFRIAAPPQDYHREAGIWIALFWSLGLAVGAYIG